MAKYFYFSGGASYDFRNDDCVLVRESQNNIKLYFGDFISTQWSSSAPGVNNYSATGRLSYFLLKAGKYFFKDLIIAKQTYFTGSFSGSPGIIWAVSSNEVFLRHGLTSIIICGITTEPVNNFTNQSLNTSFSDKIFPPVNIAWLYNSFYRQGSSFFQDIFSENNNIYLELNKIYEFQTDVYLMFLIGEDISVNYNNDITLVETYYVSSLKLPAGASINYEHSFRSIFLNIERIK